MIVVAEIGANHNGNISTAQALIAAAAEAGAQFVKFQKRCAPAMLTGAALAAPYPSPFGATYGEHRRALEFDAAQYRDLRDCAVAHKIGIFASAWDEASADFCLEMGFPIIKIASADLTNDRLLRYCLDCAKMLVVSTGMSRQEEQRHAAALLAEGTIPVVLMHCRSAYPLADADARLGEIRVLQEIAARARNLSVGYSCHAPDALPCLLAAALGVRFFEKHLTLSRAQPGGDHRASLEPSEFGALIRDLRRVPTLLAAGAGLLECERANRAKLAKCLRAARALAAGTVLAGADLCLKSPAGDEGLTGQDEGRVLGRRLRRALLAEEAIHDRDLA